MNTGNFPEMKNARRKGALARMLAGSPQSKLYESKDEEIATLKQRITSSALDVRTKKRRSK